MDRGRKNKVLRKKKEISQSNLILIINLMNKVCNVFWLVASLLAMTLQTCWHKVEAPHPKKSILPLQIRKITAVARLIKLYT